MSGFPYQKQVDEYYMVKIREVTRWMLDFVQDQKRITNNQRRELIWRAENISFSSAGEMNKYVQDLKTIGKKEKKKFYEYVIHIDWLPEGITSGVLDGKIVSRILPSPLEQLFGDTEWKSKKRE